MWEQGFPFFPWNILSVGTRFYLFSLEFFEMRSVAASFSFEVYQFAAKSLGMIIWLTMPIRSMQISDSYHQCSGVLEPSWVPTQT